MQHVHTVCFPTILLTVRGFAHGYDGGGGGGGNQVLQNDQNSGLQRVIVSHPQSLLIELTIAKE